MAMLAARPISANRAATVSSIAPASRKSGVLLVTSEPEIRQGASWDKLKSALLTHYHEPDFEAVRALCSAFAAHLLSGPPVWPMLVAPPGSMKTDLVESLDRLPKVYLVDTVTPHT